VNSLSNQDRLEQREVFDRAMVMYEERDSIRQGLWKEYSAAKQLEQARIKIDRCFNAIKLGRPQDVLEEVPDIINYAAFAERLVREGVGNESGDREVGG